MGCCSIWNLDAEVVIPAGVNLSKNPGDADDSVVSVLLKKKFIRILL